MKMREETQKVIDAICIKDVKYVIELADENDRYWNILKVKYSGDIKFIGSDLDANIVANVRESFNHGRLLSNSFNSDTAKWEFKLKTDGLLVDVNNSIVNTATSNIRVLSKNKLPSRTKLYKFFDYEVNAYNNDNKIIDTIHAINESYKNEQISSEVAMKLYKKVMVKYGK